MSQYSIVLSRSTFCLTVFNFLGLADINVHCLDSLFHEWLLISDILITLLPSRLLGILLLQREIPPSTVWLPSGTIYIRKAG